MLGNVYYMSSFTVEKISLSHAMTLCQIPIIWPTQLERGVSSCQYISHATLNLFLAVHLWILCGSKGGQYNLSACALKRSRYQEAQASWSSIKHGVTRGVGFDMISEIDLRQTIQTKNWYWWKAMNVTSSRNQDTTQEITNNFKSSKNKLPYFCWDRGFNFCS